MSRDINSESEREAFEAWVSEDGRHPYRLERNKHGGYRIEWVDDAFDGWLAAKRHAAQQSGTPLASVLEGKGEGE